VTVIALVVAGLSVVLIVSAIVGVQAMLAVARNTERLNQRAVTQLATDNGGVVSPRFVAERLKMSPMDADRLLRDMVDDVHLTMAVDELSGELRFEFLRLTQDPEFGTPGAYSRVRTR